MNERFDHIDPILLISKYLAKEASREEILWLENWVLEDIENRDLFMSLRETHAVTAILGKEKVNKKDAWEKIQDEISPIENGKIRSFPGDRRNRWLLRIAAIAIILIAAGIWMLPKFVNQGVEFYNSESLVSISELSDGSTVSLNRNTKISFENSETRYAKLEGDAFFEVKRDIEHPFIVAAEDLNIRVLGTSFYVDARENLPSIRVMVNSGRVQVSHAQESIELMKGQSVTFDKKSKELKRSEIEDINYLSWKTKTLIFEDKKLEFVVKKLEEVYGKRITLENEKIENCKITVTFKEQELAAIIAIIAEQFDLSFQIQGEEFSLAGNSCD